MEASRRVIHPPDDESDGSRLVDRNLIIGQLVGVLVILEGAREALQRDDLPLDDRKRARERAATAMVRLALLRKEIHGNHELEVQLKGLNAIPLPKTDLREDEAAAITYEKTTKSSSRNSKTA